MPKHVHNSQQVPLIKLGYTVPNPTPTSLLYWYNIHHNRLTLRSIPHQFPRVLPTIPARLPLGRWRAMTVTSIISQQTVHLSERTRLIRQCPRHAPGNVEERVSGYVHAEEVLNSVLDEEDAVAVPADCK